MKIILIELKPKYYAWLGIFLIIGILITLIIFMINGTNIINDPLPTVVSLALILPIGFYYFIALRKLEKLKEKKLYEED